MYTLYTWARTSWPAVTRPVATRSEASLVTGTLTSPAFLARLVSITLYSRLSKLIFSTSSLKSLGHHKVLVVTVPDPNCKMMTVLVLLRSLSNTQS